MFGAHELNQLDGLPLERQLVNALIKNGRPIGPEDLRRQLSPVPSLAAFTTLVGRMKAAKAIADVGEGLGLPGWLVRTPKPAPAPTAVRRLVDDDDPQPAPQTPAAPSTAVSSTQENSMPKVKRGPRVAAKVANDAVAKVLVDLKEKLDIEQIAGEAQLTVAATMKALKRLTKEKRAVCEGRGSRALYSAPNAAPTPTAIPAKTDAGGAEIPRRRATREPQANGSPKFGVFSDGSISIECANVYGELTKVEADALTAFLERVQEVRQ